MHLRSCFMYWNTHLATNMARVHTACQPICLGLAPLDTRTCLVYTVWSHIRKFDNQLYSLNGWAVNRYMPLVILVVFGQAVIAYLLVDQIVVRRRQGPPPEELTETRAEIPISDEPEAIYRGLGEILINPADTTGNEAFRFLRTSISLGVAPGTLATELDLRQPILRDLVISILTSKTTEEIDDPEDREFIKDEIKFSVERLLRLDAIQGEILEVYFTDFIIQ